MCWHFVSERLFYMRFGINAVGKSSTMRMMTVSQWPAIRNENNRYYYLLADVYARPVGQQWTEEKNIQKTINYWKCRKENVQSVDGLLFRRGKQRNTVHRVHAARLPPIHCCPTRNQRSRIHFTGTPSFQYSLVSLLRTRFSRSPVFHSLCVDMVLFVWLAEFVGSGSEADAVHYWLLRA